MLEEVKSDGSALLAGRRRARAEIVDHVVELLRSKSREELQRSAERGLVHGEALRKRRGGLAGGSHFYIKAEDDGLDGEVVEFGGPDEDPF